MNLLMRNATNQLVLMIRKQPSRMARNNLALLHKCNNFHLKIEAFCSEGVRVKVSDTKNYP